MEIDIAELKNIRKKTQAGMKDCLRALSEARGDVVLAEALLKEWGLAGVEKRAGRAMNQGRIFIRATDTRAAMAEVDCETDFAALSETFLAAGAKIAAIVFEKRLRSSDPETEDAITALAGAVKENLALRRVAYMEAGAAERVFPYLHGDGKIGALVLAKADDPAAFGDERIVAFFHDLALHVAAFKPLFLDEASVPEAYSREKGEDFRKQIEENANMAGKGAAMLEGILSGKMRKHLAEACLLEHGFVKDEKKPVAAIMRELGENSGFGLSVAGYTCFEVGDETGKE